MSSEEKQVSSANTGDHVVVIFRVRQQLPNEEAFALIGSNDILGRWQLQEPLIAERLGSHLWEKRVELPVGEIVAFNWLIISVDGIQRQESVPERRFTVDNVNSVITVTYDKEYLNIRTEDEDLYNSTIVPLSLVGNRRKSVDWVNDRLREGYQEEDHGEQDALDHAVNIEDSLLKDEVPAVSSPMSFSDDELDHAVNIKSDNVSRKLEEIPRKDEDPSVSTASGVESLSIQIESPAVSAVNAIESLSIQIEKDQGSTITDEDDDASLRCNSCFPCWRRLKDTFVAFLGRLNRIFCC